MCRVAGRSLTRPDRPEVPLQMHTVRSAIMSRRALYSPLCRSAVFLFVMCCPLMSHAEGPVALQAADSLFSQQKWSAAAAAYAKVTASEPNNGPAWTNLGESRMRQRKFDEAILAFAIATFPFSAVSRAFSVGSLALAIFYNYRADRAREILRQHAALLSVTP